MSASESKYLFLVQKLPEDLVREVSSFLPKTTLVWLNKTFYRKYHKKIRGMIPEKLYDNYIRSMVRQDNSFAFSYIAQENIIRWTCNNNIIYKNVSYPNFASLLNDFCVENNSTNCRNVLEMLLNESGLSKNQHKKNRYVSIRWRT
jgi:hypothetical protein